MKKISLVVLFALTSVWLYKRYTNYIEHKNWGTIRDPFYKKIREQAEINKTKIIVHKLCAEMTDEPVIVFCYPDSLLSNLSNKNDTSWIEHKNSFFTRIPRDFHFFHEAAFTRKEVLKMIMGKETDSTKLSNKKKGTMQMYDFSKPDRYETAITPYPTYFCYKNSSKLDTVFGFPREYAIGDFNFDREDHFYTFLHGIILSKRKLEMPRDEHIIQKRDSLAKHYYKQNEWTLQHFDYWKGS